MTHPFGLRKAPVVKVLMMLFALIFYNGAIAACIPISGLSFEKIGRNKLLASKSGSNIAIISTMPSAALPDRLGTFRFFSDKLCDSGAEDKFHIDGALYTVYTIEPFSNR